MENAIRRVYVRVFCAIVRIVTGIIEGRVVTERML